MRITSLTIAATCTIQSNTGSHLVEVGFTLEGIVFGRNQNGFTQRCERKL